jgi:hypothetical protein
MVATLLFPLWIRIILAAALLSISAYLIICSIGCLHYPDLFDTKVSQLHSILIQNSFYELLSTHALKNDWHIV